MLLSGHQCCACFGLGVSTRGFGKGRLSLQNPDPAHTWRERPWQVLSLRGGRAQGTGAGTWCQTQPRYVAPRPWALQPSHEEQGRCLCGVAMSPPQRWTGLQSSGGADHGCKYNSTTSKHTLHEAPVSVTGGWRGTQPCAPSSWSEGGEVLRAARHLQLVPSPAAASLLTGIQLGLTG